MVCEANPQCCRAQNYTIQDLHQAALTSMYHGQMRRSQLAKGGELAH